MLSPVSLWPLFHREQLKFFNIMVKVFGEEIVIEGVLADKFSLVCFLKGLREEMWEMKEVRLDMINIYVEMPWCNEMRLIETDI